MTVPFSVQLGDRIVDSCVGFVGSGEGAVREVMALQVAPGALHGVGFGRVSWQPLHGQPVRPLDQGGTAKSAKPICAGLPCWCGWPRCRAQARPAWRSARVWGRSAGQPRPAARRSRRKPAASPSCCAWFGRYGRRGRAAPSQTRRASNRAVRRTWQPFWPAPAPARASRRPAWPRRGPGREGPALRLRRQTAAQRRPPRLEL